MGKRRKHVWHCGKCDALLLVSRKQKGTKYLYCPQCRSLKSYYNFDILGALGSVAKSVVRSIPVVGGLASGLIDVAEGSMTTSPSAPVVSGVPSAAHPQRVIVHQTSTQKLKDIDELLKRK